MYVLRRVARSVEATRRVDTNSNFDGPSPPLRSQKKEQANSLRN
jgi:hypothetical protein